jgi:hypothetical protein
MHTLTYTRTHQRLIRKERWPVLRKSERRSPLAAETMKGSETKPDTGSNSDTDH